ncbi:MAG: GAF domain-containing protein [Candidatus Rokubacteria bacterium]|nr:GAF domain-containing protein [Candidatus Rokubacteria bacterium]
MRWRFRRRKGARALDPIAAALVESLDAGVVVVDLRLTIVAWNPALERLSGVAAAVARGARLDAVLPKLGDLPLADHLARAVGGESPVSGEVACERAGDGHGGVITARYVPVRAPNARVLGVAAVITDVTERRRRAEFVRALEDIGRSLNTSLRLDEVLDTIVNQALDVMRAESALVVSWDGEAPEFRVMRATGRLSDDYATRGRIPVTGGPISRAVLESRVVTTSNILADPRLWLTPERRAQIGLEGFQAVAATPLSSKGRVHGALVVHYWTERTFTDDEVAALGVLGEQAALAVDNARVYADATRRADRLRELTEVERLVTASLDLDDVLARIARATARLVDVPLVGVWTTDPGTRTVRRRAASVDPRFRHVPTPPAMAYGEGIVGLVAETRTPIYVADVREDPRVFPVPEAIDAGLTVLLAVPIVSGETVLGVLGARAAAGALAEEEDRALVASLAARAAVAMQNARVYEQAVRRAARLRELAAISQSVTSSLDGTDVMRRIAGAAAEMTTGALSAVHAYDPERNLLRFAGTSDAAWDGLPNERPANAGLPGLVFERRAPVLVADPITHPRTLSPDWWKARPGATYCGMPIMVGPTFVGVLDFVLPAGLPDAEQQEALQLLAAHAGIAIRNAWLYQSERVQAERIRALADVNRRISSALDLDELLRAISESAAQLTGAKFVAFWLADEPRRRLALMAGSVPEMADDFPARVATYDQGAVGWVARHHAPLVIDDVFQDSRPLAGDWLRRWNLSSLSAYPVRAGGELLAVLAFVHHEPLRLSADARAVIDMFMAQASVAIRNARLYREAGRRREMAEALARLGRELTGTLDVERMAELVARGVVQVLETRGAAVYRLETDGSLPLLAAFGIDAGVVRTITLQPGEGLGGRAVAERRVVVSRNVLQDPTLVLSPWLRDRIERSGYRMGVGIPLVAHDRVVGVITIAAEEGREFSTEDLQSLQTFADQAALAFENARLYKTAQDSLARLRETQAQLVQAAKLSALGQLVSGVAHELNNPLSVIIGYGQLLLSRDMPEPIKHPVQLMVAQGDRMAKIVRNLLYFARQRPPERGPADVHQVIEQTLALRANQLSLLDIKIEREFAADLPTINADPQQLQQVFLNLLLNAEQAITTDRQGGGRIVFRTSLAPGKKSVRAQVIDDGPGIRGDDMPHVFEPFFTTKEVGVGTGLGLSVSYGIVEEHGGRLSVESRPGETVFTLELPVGEVTEQPVAPPAPAAALASSGQGRVALVVEDEVPVLDLVSELLREVGWDVDTAPGGRMALEKLRARRYDVVVSDVRMPDGDGESLYRGALGVDRTLRGRWVIITGDTANREALKFLREEGLPILEKPFQPALFLDVVRRLASSLTATTPSA